MTTSTKSILKIVLGIFMIFFGLPAFINGSILLFGGLVSHSHHYSTLGTLASYVIIGLALIIFGIRTIIKAKRIIKQSKENAFLQTEAPGSAAKSKAPTPKQNKMIGVCLLVPVIPLWIMGDGGSPKNYNGYLVLLGWIFVIASIIFFNKKSKTF